MGERSKLKKKKLTGKMIAAGAAILFAGALLSGCHAGASRQSTAIRVSSVFPGSSEGSAAVSSAPVSRGVSSRQKASSEVSSASSSSEAVSSAETSPKGKVAYLTFDDGPSSYSPQVLSILKKNNVHATFFIAFMGSDTAQKRAWVKEEYEAGNTIGLHSFTHNYQYIYANEANFFADFNRMKTILTQITGKSPNLIRFPGGLGNTVSIKYSGGIIMPKLLKDAEAMGFTAFDWNAGGEDAELPLPTVPKLASEILAECRGEQTALILMHDTHSITVGALPTIISSLRAQGYSFETLTPQSKTFQERCVISVSHKRTVSSSPVKPAVSAVSAKAAVSAASSTK